jgi:hypothetical protein
MWLLVPSLRIVAHRVWRSKQVGETGSRELLVAAFGKRAQAQFPPAICACLRREVLTIGVGCAGIKIHHISR